MGGTSNEVGPSVDTFLRTVRALVVTSFVSFGLLTVVARFTGLGMLAPMVVLFVGSWLAFATILMRALGGGTWRGIVVAVGTFFFVFALFVAEVRGLIAWWHWSPPPRPMFHNHFGDREQTLLPSWDYPSPMCDRADNAAWVDHEDNVVVVVLDAVVGGSLEGPTIGYDETRFQIGHGSTRRLLTIARTTNRFFVIREDGEVAEFVLPPNLVRSVCEAHRQSDPADVLDAIGELLDARTRADIAAFVVSAARESPAEE